MVFLSLVSPMAFYFGCLSVCNEAEPNSISQREENEKKKKENVCMQATSSSFDDGGMWDENRERKF